MATISGIVQARTKITPSTGTGCGIMAPYLDQGFPVGKAARCDRPVHSPVETCVRSEYMADPPRPLNEAVGSEHAFAFLLIPGFTLLGFTSAIEPLRMANMVAGHRLYSAVTVSLDGAELGASNGFRVTPDYSIGTMPQVDTVIVCGANPIRYPDADRLVAWLRSLDGEGVALGSVDSGTDLLARADLLQGYRCTTHWQDLGIVAARYPDLLVSNHLYEIDRDRFTSGGGTAAMDMMLELIRRSEHGPAIAASTADLLVHDRVRDGHDRQRVPLRQRVGTDEPGLRTAVAIMEGTVDDPLSIAEIASHAKLSERQLARLFRKHLDCTPTRYYRDLRLYQARRELLYNDAGIPEVAELFGFGSPSYFVRRYTERFGVSPSVDRRRGMECVD